MELASNGQQFTATENALTAQLAEAYGRYEGNVKVAARYRDNILPRQFQAYRLQVRLYQLDAQKVGFSDIVNAQQNLAQSLQGYLTALNAQWQAVVDVANIAQQEELFPLPAPPNRPSINARVAHHMAEVVRHPARRLSEQRDR